MGLTFQQQFYHVPETVYLVQFLEPGDAEGGRAVYAIVEKPEDEDLLDFNLKFENAGYVLQEIDFDKLIIEGYNLLKEIEEVDDDE